MPPALQPARASAASHNRPTRRSRRKRLSRQLFWHVHNLRSSPFPWLCARHAVIQCSCETPKRMVVGRRVGWRIGSPAGVVGRIVLVGAAPSLAQVDGRRTLLGLNAAVRIERDHLGVPTILATNRLDATRALGFLHAQDRFFQMDLSRRVGSGELSELSGVVQPALRPKRPFPLALLPQRAGRLAQDRPRAFPTRHTRTRAQPGRQGPT